MSGYGEDHYYAGRAIAATGWFVGILVVLAMLAIGYLVFAANAGV